MKLGKNYWKLWSAHAISNLGDGVSVIAYPWLASAVTRSPILIALVTVVSRLPWLLFTLPAGVITDRFDRRKILVIMDVIRGILACSVAIAVTIQASTLPALNSITGGVELETNWFLLSVLLVTAFLFGCAEVLRDNAAQTLLPTVVEEKQLEAANGKLWSVEFLANSLLGPMFGTFIIGVAIFLPFYFDAVTFFVSAALISLIVRARPTSLNRIEGDKTKSSFKEELKAGFSWLWGHKLLRSMAIILGIMNLIGGIMTAVFILFAQEILETSVLEFAILGTAGAVGGIFGGVVGPRISKRLGSGTSLRLTLLIIPVTSLAIGLTSNWQFIWFLTALSTVAAVLWNIITVSLRQTIIPGEILGRVNSVYRFFGWGSLPIGSLIGGGLVSILESIGTRESALRAPFFLSALLGFIIYFFAAPRLTTTKIEESRNS